MLEDKIIILAGAGFVGSGCARRYFQENARVVIGDIDGEAARRLAAEIDPSGARVFGTELDGGEESSIKALVDFCVSKFGGLHGFHANFASFLNKEGGIEMPVEVYDEVMRINARGHFLCSRYAVPAMIASGGGAMLYTSSGDAYSGDVDRVAYAMSKTALHALMRSVANRYGDRGIRANVISPGVIMHERLAALTTEEWKEKMMQRLAIKGRFGKPEDIAAMSALLLSDQAGYITGQVINVDGGAVMRA